MNVPPPQRPWIPLAIPNRTRPACKFNQQMSLCSRVTADTNPTHFIFSVFSPIHGDVLQRLV